jgi:MFS family permease
MALSASRGFGVLRHRNFSFYLAARILGTFAVQMQSVAIGWQVYAKTGNVFDLGLIGLAQFAPFLVLILIAGHAADRYNRRNIVLICFGMQLLCSALLFAYTLSGINAVWPVFAILAIYGSARAFMMPATQAILIHLVPTESFSQAVALSSSTFQIAIILAPTLGGLLYLAGPMVVYGVVGTLLLISFALMTGVRVDIKAEKPQAATWHSLLEGLRFVFSTPVVLGAISLDLFAVLFGGATALLPAYANDVLHAGPTALGLLRTSTGIGAVFTSVVLAFFPISRHVGRWMFGGVGLFGLATVVMGTTHTLILAMICLFLMGAGDMVSVYIRHILVQYATPDAIRGRVSAVNAVFIGASNELGEFESGITAGWFGLIPAIVLGGVATLAVTGIWAWRFPVISRMDRFPELQRKDADKA